MKSNFRFFFRQSVMLLLVSLAYGAFLSLVTMEPGDGLNELISVMILGSFIMNIGYHIGFYKKEIPMAVSFGSTRRNLIRGLLFYDLVSLLLVSLTIFVIAVLGIPEWREPGLFLLLIIAHLASSVFGMAAGICIYKCGKIVGIAVIGVLSLLGGFGVGFTIAFLNDRQWNFTINSIMLTVFAVIVLLWVIVQFVQARVLRRYAY